MVLIAVCQAPNGQSDVSPRGVFAAFTDRHSELSLLSFLVFTPFEVHSLSHSEE